VLSAFWGRLHEVKRKTISRLTTTALEGRMEIFL
jgi:hypothetical protein